jgi:hypothetical protein
MHASCYAGMGRVFSIAVHCYNYEFRFHRVHSCLSTAKFYELIQNVTKIKCKSPLVGKNRTIPHVLHNIIVDLAYFAYRYK